MEEKKKEEMESRGGKGSGEEFNEKRKEKLSSIYIYRLITDGGKQDFTNGKGK